MELLVVLGLFAMVVTAASDIFLLANRSQHKVLGFERAQADARFTMEAIAREFRTGTVDYAYYAGRGTPIGVPEGELALIDSTNAALKFFLSDASTEGACADAASRPCLLVSIDAGPPSAITPKGVAVRSAAFYLSPSADPTAFNPATGSYAADEQPRVTVVLGLESVAERAGERSMVYLQTTVGSRKYKR